MYGQSPDHWSNLQIRSVVLGQKQDGVWNLEAEPQLRNLESISACSSVTEDFLDLFIMANHMLTCSINLKHILSNSVLPQLFLNIIISKLIDLENKIIQCEQLQLSFQKSVQYWTSNVHVLVVLSARLSATCADHWAAPAALVSGWWRHRRRSASSTTLRPGVPRAPCSLSEGCQVLWRDAWPVRAWRCSQLALSCSRNYRNSTLLLFHMENSKTQELKLLRGSLY